MKKNVNNAVTTAKNNAKNVNNNVKSAKSELKNVLTSAFAGINFLNKIKDMKVQDYCLGLLLGYSVADMGRYVGHIK